MDASPLRCAGTRGRRLRRRQSPSVSGESDSDRALKRARSERPLNAHAATRSAHTPAAGAVRLLRARDRTAQEPASKGGRVQRPEGRNPEDFVIDHAANYARDRPQRDKRCRQQERSQPELKPPSVAERSDGHEREERHLADRPCLRRGAMCDAQRQPARELEIRANDAGQHARPLADRRAQGLPAGRSARKEIPQRRKVAGRAADLLNEGGEPEDACGQQRRRKRLPRRAGRPTARSTRRRRAH